MKSKSKAALECRESIVRALCGRSPLCHHPGYLILFLIFTSPPSLPASLPACLLQHAAHVAAGIRRFTSINSAQGGRATEEHSGGVAASLKRGKAGGGAGGGGGGSDEGFFPPPEICSLSDRYR